MGWIENAWFLLAITASQLCNVQYFLILDFVFMDFKRLMDNRPLARWVSRNVVDGLLLNKVVLFFICCRMNFSFEQAL